MQTRNFAESLEVVQTRNFAESLKVVQTRNFAESLEVVQTIKFAEFLEVCKQENSLNFLKYANKKIPESLEVMQTRKFAGSLEISKQEISPNLSIFPQSRYFAKSVQTKWNLLQVYLDFTSSFVSAESILESSVAAFVLLSGNAMRKRNKSAMTPAIFIAASAQSKPRTPQR